jgi:phospholipid/cholesterol/gamma-HCH transport system substrate-binding protein
VFLALQSANLLSLSWQSTYRVTARFDNIGGLKPRRRSRAPAWWWGAWARSASTTSASRRWWRWTWTAYKFPSDSSLKILTSGLLGEQYIGIEAGASTPT